MITPEQLTTTEEEIRALWEQGEIPYLTHLAGGNEKELIDIFRDIKPTDWVFASHRAHFHYTLHGHTDLVEQVRTGKSMFLFGPRFIASAIVAGTACIAAGMALSIKLRGGSEWVYCFVGDGAEDQGHFYEAVWFVHERQLPCVFVVEDNDSSCGVTREQRRGSDWPRPWPSCVRRYHYKPTWPHAGSNVRPQLKWKVSA